MTDKRNTAARIAVQFGRQTPAQSMTVDDIADDAVSLARHGAAARKALERQRCPSRHMNAARAIAARYGARLIEQGDIEGAVMLMEFTEGWYGAGSLTGFFIA